jgi:hypothetical protein
MSKYSSQITLVETGECMKEDTVLGVKFLVSTLWRAIDEDKRDKVLQLVQFDMDRIIERIRG